jgi:hypothetical protein
MRDPDPVVILSCGHVQVEKDDHCATTDCPNFSGFPKPQG